MLGEYFADLFVESKLIVELKASPINKAHDLLWLINITMSLQAIQKQRPLEIKCFRTNVPLFHWYDKPGIMKEYLA